MGRIHVLDFSVANLIAAGEVVDRPSSAVKEMIENSIDAGAHAITVEIKKGGIAFLRVTDDGCGMSREDAETCVRRHATSKIREASDLDGILTLGFRGEALAAIAAVSRLRIMTRLVTDEIGTLVCLEEGQNLSVSDAGCPVGTTIIAEELFANVPARRKFLKTDATETASVGAVVEKMALSHPEISFRFLADSTPRLSTPGDGKLLHAVHAVFGQEFSQNLIPVSGMTNGIGIHGFIGSPNNIRKNRNFENVFLNGRYVKSRTVSASLEQAFDSYIPEDKFPVCILNIELHPSLVDVNVHPAKLEVKFANEKMIFDSVYTAVRTTLMENIKRPVMDLSEQYRAEMAKTKLDSPFVPITPHAAQQKKPSFLEPLDPKREGTLTEKSPRTEEKTAPVSLSSEPEKENKPHSFSPASVRPEKEEKPIVPPASPRIGESSKEISEEKTEEKKPEIPEKKQENGPQTAPSPPPPPESPAIGEEKEKKIPYKIVGEAFYSYVMVETPDRLLMVDKHAAHERILFEKMKKRMSEQAVSSQLLIMPIRANLTFEEYSAAQEYQREFSRFGFDYELVAENHSAKLIQIPSDLSVADAVITFGQMCADLNEGRSADVSREILFEKAIYQTACKAAVKAGQMNQEGDVEYIIDRLMRLDNIKYCPHGRPVAFEITRDWLNNRFKRT